MASKILTVIINGDPKGAVAAMAEAGAATEGWGAKLAKTTALAGVAVVAAGVGIGVALFKVGESFDAAYDHIRVGTGATGAVLEGLKDDFRGVVASVPTSFADAGTAISNINARLGITGPALQGVSEQMLELSRITKTDLTGNIDNMTRVFGDWGIPAEKMSSSLDEIYRASQATGFGVTDLSAQVVQFGAPLRNLGFSFDQSISLLGLFNKTGVNSDTVLAGMKISVGNLAKAGENVPTTFRRIVDEIQKAGPGTEATSKAIALFGKRAGPDLADAITGGKFAIDDIMNSITGGSDTILGAAKDTEDFGEKWTLFKNKVLLVIEPIASRVFDGIGNAMDWLGQKAGPVLHEIAGGFQVMIETFTGTGDAVASSGLQSWFERIGVIARNVWDAVSSIDWGSVFSTAGTVASVALSAISDAIDWISKNLDIVVPLVAALGAAFLAFEVVTGIIDAISAAMVVLDAVMNANPIGIVIVAIAGLAAGLYAAYEKVGWFHTAVDAAWDGIQAVVSWAWNNVIKPVLDNWQIAIVVLMGPLGLLVDVVVDNWAKITGAISWAWNSVIQPVWSAISGFITTYLIPYMQSWWSVVQDVWNAIATVISWVWNSVLQPIFQGIETWIQNNLIPAWNATMTAAQIAWGAISTAVQAAWDSVIQPVWSAISGFITTYLIPYMQSWWNTVQTVWGAVGSVVSSVWNSAISPTFEAIKSGIGFVIDMFNTISGAIGSAFSSVADAIIGPFKTGFNAIANLWNNTVGRLSVHTPDIPGTDWGGIDFTMPKIPTFHTGGIVPGLPGSEMLALVQAGERIIPAADARNAAGSGDTYVTNHIYMPAGSNGADVVDAIKRYERNNGTAWRN